MKPFEKLAAGAWAVVAGFSALDAAGAIPAGFLAAVPLCPFHALTGVPCPGCGMTRALVAALQGHWGASVYFHPRASYYRALDSRVGLGLINHFRGRAFSYGFPNVAAESAAGPCRPGSCRLRYPPRRAWPSLWLINTSVLRDGETVSRETLNLLSRFESSPQPI